MTDTTARTICFFRPNLGQDVPPSSWPYLKIQQIDSQPPTVIVTTDASLAGNNDQS